jgi:sec-independent protein translocase protein TatC
MSKDSDKNSDIDTISMSLGDHLEELRARIILALLGLAVGLIISLIFGSYIIAVIEAPYINVMGNDARLQTLAPAEGFASYMKISLICGLVISSPWVFYHLWMFVAAGLYPKEKKFVYKLLPFSICLFVAGALFFIFIVAPMALRFLIKFNENVLGVSSYFTFNRYIAFVTLLMLVFGVGFQTPIVIFFLNRTGLVTLDAMKKSRKYVIFGAFILSAVITPPDVVSQISLAIPLYLLFELGMVMGHIDNRTRRKKE